MKRLLIGLTLLITLMGGAQAVFAVPIELALVVDASGSIDGSEWTLQMTGYANAITAAVPTNGTVAISVTRFATDATVVRAMTTISSVADRTALASFFTGLSQSGNGIFTCISCGIFAAEGTLTGTAGKSIIDVTTDGSWNTGVDPAGPAGTVGTSRWAVANQADVVNAIGIGTGSPPDFNFGPGSFSLVADDFGDFQNVLTTKLQREIVPEPTSLLLFGMGLGALGLASYRRNKK